LYQAVSDALAGVVFQAGLSGVWSFLTPKVGLVFTR
jgi:hypothetical protein